MLTNAKRNIKSKKCKNRFIKKKQKTIQYKKEKKTHDLYPQAQARPMGCENMRNILNCFELTGLAVIFDHPQRITLWLTIVQTLFSFLPLSLLSFFVSVSVLDFVFHDIELGEVFLCDYVFDLLFVMFPRLQFPPVTHLLFCFITLDNVIIFYTSH